MNVSYEDILALEANSVLIDCDGEWTSIYTW